MNTPTDDEREALIARLHAVIDDAVSDAYLVQNDRGVTRADQEQTDAQVKEAETVRDAVIEALRRSEEQQGEPTDAQVQAAAGVMPCVWSPAEPNHPDGADCDRCTDRARAALRAAAGVR